MGMQDCPCNPTNASPQKRGSTNLLSMPQMLIQSPNRKKTETCQGSLKHFFILLFRYYAFLTSTWVCIVLLINVATAQQEAVCNTATAKFRQLHFSAVNLIRIRHRSCPILACSECFPALCASDHPKPVICSVININAYRRHQMTSTLWLRLRLLICTLVIKCQNYSSDKNRFNIKNCKHQLRTMLTVLECSKEYMNITNYYIPEILDNII